MSKVSKYLAAIGRRGGLKSRRTLDPETARQMVRLREARRAFRRFHDECFPSFPADRILAKDDIPWVAERLIGYGQDNARQTGARLLAPGSASRGWPFSDTTSAAEIIRLKAVRGRPRVDRLRQALALSDAMRVVTLAGLRKGRPGQSDLELVELLLGVRLVPASHRR